jgi:hypothetical protein
MMLVDIEPPVATRTALLASSNQTSIALLSALATPVRSKKADTLVQRVHFPSGRQLGNVPKYMAVTGEEYRNIEIAL